MAAAIVSTLPAKPQALYIAIAARPRQTVLLTRDLTCSLAQTPCVISWSPGMGWRAPPRALAGEPGRTPTIMSQPGPPGSTADRSVTSHSKQTHVDEFCHGLLDWMKSELQAQQLATARTCWTSRKQPCRAHCLDKHLPVSAASCWASIATVGAAFQTLLLTFAMDAAKPASSESSNIAACA